MKNDNIKKQLAPKLLLDKSIYINISKNSIIEILFYPEFYNIYCKNKNAEGVIKNPNYVNDFLKYIGEGQEYIYTLRVGDSTKKHEFPFFF